MEFQGAQITREVYALLDGSWARIKALGLHGQVLCNRDGFDVVLPYDKVINRDLLWQGKPTKPKS